MLELRRADERGNASFGWLTSRHTFSFGSYFDPRQMGFSDLRVINDDWVQPGKGFDTHPHQDMEIFTYVLAGALEHRDSMGNGSIIRPGDVQMMSAGTGIRHSEFNPSPQDPVHLLQIWIVPDRLRVAPRYQQVHFPDSEKRGRLRLIISRVEDALEQHRAEVALAGVGQDDDDGLAGVLRLAGVTAAAATAAPQEMPRGCLPRAPGAGRTRPPLRSSPARRVDQRQVEHVGHEAGADALDLVRTGLERFARARLREHRAGGGLHRDRVIALPRVFLM
jgi:uncharacterized cupin superfamily protein